MLKARKEDFKIGRKKFGQIVHHTNGKKTFVINRTLGDMHRGKNGYLSHGIQDGVAAWSVETMLLSKMRSRDIDAIAIKIRSTGEVYITTLDAFIEHSTVMTQRRRNNSMQRSLLLKYFIRKEGKVKL